MGTVQVLPNPFNLRTLAEELTTDAGRTRMLIDRDVAARLGRETVAILDEGGYTSPSGRSVALRAALDSARTGTVEYPPEHELPLPMASERHSTITVENETVLAVGRRLFAEGRVAALNFAAADSPGGGFLGGARAQEESIARSSGLVAAVAHSRMYPYHRGRRDPMYTDYVIYSPDVPVFRTDEGELLEEPWTLSILTCPAVNGLAVQRDAPERMALVPRVMQRRTAKVLSIAAAHGVRRLVLGAWGCGAFGLEPAMMAAIFRDALQGPFRGVFDRIVFAVTDWSPDEHFIGPFRRAFDRVPQS